jgi:hypothetical protein
VLAAAVLPALPAAVSDAAVSDAAVSDAAVSGAVLVVIVVLTVGDVSTDLVSCSSSARALAHIG